MDCIAFGYIAFPQHILRRLAQKLTKTLTYIFFKVQETFHIELGQWSIDKRPQETVRWF